ncbi:MAG TPA: YggS family pyridoxal phosphate-dependent enzyme [Clostridiaceae bacterium]|nr:YggS family pyridoxal phosphate-dependent enzyme [Clostridiaceae bacterium]
MINEIRRQEIADNLAEVKTEIKNTCEMVGRDPEEVRLIAVSKNFPVADIECALLSGQYDFGENRVQELTPKIDALVDHSDINWHLIGTLQRNKVKFVTGRVVFIHSVDTLRLINQIQRLSAKNECCSDILLQVNISGEETKFGFEPEDLDEAFEHTLKTCPQVRIRGLMTMAPWYDDPDDTKPVFAEAARLIAEFKEKYQLDYLDQLSMGMSHDYKQAIACGSTMVRIGTAIFGHRDYSS